MLAWDAAGAPAAWEIVASGEGGMLRLGQRLYRLDDVAGCRATATSELNIDGHLLAIGVFLLAGCAFLLPVALGVAHPRFLVGAVLFFAIGLMVLADIVRGHRQVMHRVEISLADGERVRFASIDPAVCQGLAEALARGRMAA